MRYIFPEGMINLIIMGQQWVFIFEAQCDIDVTAQYHLCVAKLFITY